MSENIYILSDRQLMVSVGEKIRHWRLQQNFSQEKLSEFSGVSVSTIKKVESGKAISLDRFIRVLRTLRKLDVFNGFIAEDELSPATYFEVQSKVKTRKRASKDLKK